MKLKGISNEGLRRIARSVRGQEDNRKAYEMGLEDGSTMAHESEAVDYYEDTMEQGEESPSGQLINSVGRSNLKKMWGVMDEEGWVVAEKSYNAGFYAGYNEVVDDHR